MKFQSIALMLIFVLIAAREVRSEFLTLVDSFATSGGIGLAFDAQTDTVWTYGSDTLRSYDRTGNLLNTITNAPGESGDDADLDFADVAFTLGSTPIPAGTLLFTNGETGTAEVYAIAPDGTLLATLNTSFGASHVVGSAYSAARDSFFMVQDQVPSAALDNLVAEVDAQTGAVLNTFDLDIVAPDFDINYGDLEVSSVTGNLLLVSNIESTVLELSPTGLELDRWTISPGSGGSVMSSGIALDDLRNEVYTQSTSGTVFRFAAVPEPSSLFLLEFGLAAVLLRRGKRK